jgi:hypothetical protein
VTFKSHLLERLRELALVDLDALCAGEPASVLAAYIADLEDALGQARAAIRDAHRELGAGADPLGLLDLGPERRVRADGDPGARLAARAAARRELALLEELVLGVLPRLVEADRRWVATSS